MSRINASQIMAVLTALLLLSACQSSDDYKAQTAVYSGSISPQTLLANFPEFQRQYQNYKVSDEELSAAKLLQGKRIVVLFGTWCHDSEREVPRLLKALDMAGLSELDLSLIAVDLNKQVPGGVEQNYQLKYTPTFIVSEQEKEVARVVERPKTTVAQDLAQQSTSFK